MKIRIMLVDDHEIVRNGVANLIRREPDFQIVGEASDGESAVDLAREIRPDAILMDINLPGMDGIQATRIICDELKDVRIIGFSVYDGRFIGEVLLIVPDVLATRDSAWISSTFSVIKHV
jgi:DNA-binding NarL/FixJ family response regulator